MALATDGSQVSPAASAAEESKAAPLNSARGTHVGREGHQNLGLLPDPEPWGFLVSALFSDSQVLTACFFFFLEWDLSSSVLWVKPPQCFSVTLWFNLKQHLFNNG